MLATLEIFVTNFSQAGLSTPEIFKSGELIRRGHRDVTVGVYYI